MSKLNVEEVIGRIYGRLTVVGLDRIEPRIIQTTGKQNGWNYYLVCECECGNTCVVSYTDLRRKHTVSCGCYKREQTTKRNKEMFSTANGESVGQYKRLYGIYKGMLNRCYKLSCKEYKYYGARGIALCDEWLGNNGYTEFKKWSIENGYTDKLEIERKDNNQGYSPTNCRWASRKEQMRNTRRSKLITYNGETKTLSEWCEILGLNYARVEARLRLGHTVEEAFSCHRYEVIHKSDACCKKVVLDGYVFDSIKTCCYDYLKQTTGSFSKYLNGLKPAPKKWQDRGLRFYNEETDKYLPMWNAN